jgi:hypothetical protein
VFGFISSLTGMLWATACRPGNGMLWLNPAAPASWQVFILQPHNNRILQVERDVILRAACTTVFPQPAADDLEASERLGALPDDRCYMPCGGAADEMCGGPSANR